MLAEYADSVPVALVIEPDSVGNLVTNADDPKCGSGATQAAIETGVPYAIKSLKAACADCADTLLGTTLVASGGLAAFVLVLLLLSWARRKVSTRTITWLKHFNRVFTPLTKLKARDR